MRICHTALYGLKFSNKEFSNFPIKLLGSVYQKLSKEVFINNEDGLKSSYDIYLKLLTQHALQKKKYIRGSQRLSMTKQFSKEMMKRSRLCNNYLRKRTEEYNRSRNYFVSVLRRNLRKSTMKT